MPDQESSSGKKIWIVSEEDGEIRLDAFVRRRLPQLSRREAENAIGGKFFWVNDRPAKKGDRLFNGDRLTWKGPDHWLAEGPLADFSLEVPVLHEDDFLMAVDKPAGMAVHGFSGRETGTLANFLAACRPSLCGVGTSRWEPGLVHRLDRDTSGVVLIAKRQQAFEALGRQFRRGAVRKLYRGLVRGTIDVEGSVAYPLVHDPADRRKMKAVVEASASRGAGARPWKALTRFRRLACAGEFSLVELEMKTGVTHQLRAHLSAIGHPIVGDRLYQDRPEPLGLARHFLHALSVEFRHPASGEKLKVEAPLAPELAALLRRLGMEG